MRFSERSRICLIPRRHAPANPFGGDPIACNLLLSPENRMRFSGDRGDKSEIRVAGRGKRQIQRIWTFGSFIQTARHANLMNGFAGACLRRIREIRDRSFPFFMGPDQRSGPVRNEKNAILDLSFPLRGIRQIRDRSEKSMLFSERSSIFPSIRFFSDISPDSDTFYYSEGIVKNIGVGENPSFF